jgi:hypothetical protein
VHGGFVLRVDAKVKARAVDDARRHGDPETPRYKRVADAVAREASFGPRFAAATAPRARGAEEDLDRHNSAPLRLLSREADLCFQRFCTLARTLREELLANARDEVSDRRKIDRDLISETIRIRLHAHAG